MIADSRRRSLAACRPVFGRSGGTTPPVLLGGGTFGMLLYPAAVTREGQRMWPPLYAARFELHDGSLIELSRLGSGSPGPEPDGALGVREGPTGPDRLAARQRHTTFLSLYDEILPAFEAGQRGDPTTCKHFLTLYESEVSPLLRPFLDPFGAAMLSWLRQNAR